jgi:hypothetical protein
MNTPAKAGQRQGSALFHGLVVAALALFILLPFAQSLIMSFTSTMPRDGIPEGSYSFINFISIAVTPDLRESVLNSTFYVLLNVTLCLVAWDCPPPMPIRATASPATAMCFSCCWSSASRRLWCSRCPSSFSSPSSGW